MNSQNISWDLITIDSIIPHPSFFTLTEPFPNRESFNRYIRSMTALLTSKPFLGNTDEIRRDIHRLLVFQKKLIQLDMYKPSNDYIHFSWKEVLDQLTNVLTLIENRLPIIERMPKTRTDQGLSDMLLVDPRVFFEILKKWLSVRDYINEENKWIKKAGALNRLVGLLFRMGYLFKSDYKWMTIGLAFNEYYKLGAETSNFKESKDKGSRTEFKDLELLMKSSFKPNY